MLRKLFDLTHGFRKWYWATFNIKTFGVRVMILKNEKEILLVTHSYLDLWVMPGGRIERGESAETAARREAMEEVNIELKSLRQLGVYQNTGEGRNDTVTVFVSTDWIDHGRRWNWEIKDSGFFPFDQLPAQTSIATRKRLGEYLSGRPDVFGGSWV